MTLFPEMIISWGLWPSQCIILWLTHKMVVLLGGRAFGRCQPVGVSLPYGPPSPSLAVLVWGHILFQAFSTMTNWAFWNCQSKSIFPSISCFCWVFGHCEEKNNEYTRGNLQRTSPPESKENLGHRYGDLWFLILTFRRQKQDDFSFEGSLD